MNSLPIRSRVLLILVLTNVFAVLMLTGQLLLENSTKQFQFVRGVNSLIKQAAYISSEIDQKYQNDTEVGAYINRVLQDNPSIKAIQYYNLKEKTLVKAPMGLSQETLSNLKNDAGIVDSSGVVVLPNGNIQIHSPLMNNNAMLFLTMDPTFDAIVGANIAETIVLLLIFLVMVTLYFTDYFVEPLSTISKAMNHIVVNMDMTQRISVEREDEIGQVAADFNTMLDSVQHFSQQLSKSNKELTRSKMTLEEALLAKSQFLSTMSHEIRTPMNGVIGMIDLLASTPLSKEQQEYVKIAEQSAESLLAVIDQILNFSKLENHKVVLEPKEFDLHGLIAEIETRMTLMTRRLDKQFDCEYPESLPQRVMGDSFKLKQILNNFLNNAIKFTEPGAHINLSCYEENIEDKNKIQLKFCVSDNGIGISEKECRELFKPFQQTSSSNHSQLGGTGLGLAISMEIAKLMGGECWVESTLGKGSHFYARVILDKVDKKSVHVVKKSEPDLATIQAAIKQKKEPVVLVAEDNHVNQLLIKKMLQKMGCEVILAENGAVAFEIMKTQDIDLILMDYNMPIMNGVEATKEIRAYEQENHIPAVSIIAVTANAFLTDKENCLNCGMNDFIPKPFTAKHLQTVLNGYLK